MSNNKIKRLEIEYGKSFRELLRHRLIDLDMSEKETADNLGISRMTVLRYMKKYALCKNNDLFTQQKFYNYKKLKLRDDDDFKGVKHD